MKFLVSVAVAVSVFVSLLQPGLRPSLTPAETLLEPKILESIRVEVVEGSPDVGGTGLIQGAGSSRGEIVLSSDASPAASRAIVVLQRLIETRALPRPARTIRFVEMNAALPANAKAAILLRGISTESALLRNLW